MSSDEKDSLPEGWEMHKSSSAGGDVVYYVNTQSKKSPFPKPNRPTAAVTPQPWVVHPSSSSSAYDSSTPSVSSRSPTTSVSSTSPTSHDDPSSSSTEEIKCSHILIKHNGSRNPTSWRSDKVRRTKEEALVIINDFRDQIINKETKFEDIAKVFSDCSSGKRYGDLGRFRRGKMQKAFEEVAFKLKLGQLSKPVETRSGIHLILRTV